MAIVIINCVNTQAYTCILLGDFTICPLTHFARVYLLPSQKRLSGLSISLAGIIPGPVVGGAGGGNSSVPPSPLRPDFALSDPPFGASAVAAGRLQAVRRIDFQARIHRGEGSWVFGGAVFGRWSLGGAV